MSKFMLNGIAYCGSNDAKYYYGTSAPSNSLGAEDDLYFQLNGNKVLKTYVKLNNQWRELPSGGGGSSTLIDKIITENGIFNPADDEADGYSLVTVNIPEKIGGVYNMYQDNNLIWNPIFASAEQPDIKSEDDFYNDFDFSLGVAGYTENRAVVLPDYSKLNQGEYSATYDDTSTSGLRNTIIATQPIIIKQNHLPTKITFDLVLGNSYANKVSSADVNYKCRIGLVSTYVINNNWSTQESWIPNGYSQYDTVNTTLLHEEINLTNIDFTNISRAWLKINAPGWTYKINNVEVVYS